MPDEPQRGRIFISYRRDDVGAVAGRLADRLNARFGPETVFMDIDSIPLGRDFKKAIETAVGSCDVLLAVIGPRWLSAADEHGRRRIDLPGDLVALEISAALTRDIPVFPILVEGAMPLTEDAELPRPLATLPNLQARRLDNDRFSGDIATLIRFLEPIISPHDAAEPAPPTSPLAVADPPRPTPDERRPRPTFAIVTTVAALAVVIAAIGLLLGSPGATENRPDTPSTPTSSAVPPTQAAPSQAAPTTTAPDTVFSDDFAGDALDPRKWRTNGNAAIQQTDGHLRLFVRPGSGVDYAKLQPLPLTRPFTDVRFTVTMPAPGRGDSGGGSFVINPGGQQPQILTFGPGNEGGAVAFPLTCDLPQCRIGRYADFTESSFHYPAPPRPGDVLSIEIVKRDGHLVYLINGAQAGMTKNDTGPLTDFWFAVSATSQESWDLLIDNLVVS